MTSIDPRQPFFPSFEQNTHLPEEPPAPFVPLSKKTKQPSKEEPRQAPSGGKLVHSRPASTYTATSSKPETARKPLQNKQNKQSSESSVNSQSTSPSKTDTLTEQAVHARNGGGQQEQGKGGNSGGGGGVTTADVSGVAQMSAAQVL